MTYLLLLTEGYTYMLYFRILQWDFQRDKGGSELSRWVGLRGQGRLRTSSEGGAGRIAVLGLGLVGPRGSAWPALRPGLPSLKGSGWLAWGLA